MSAAASIDVWHVDLENSDWDGCIGFLAMHEVALAQRFREPRQQAYARRCRAALRQALASYVDRPPSTLVFQYNEYGKPMLAGQSCHFNLSHSGNRAVIAVAGQQIGIDLEAVVMSASEIRELTELVCHPLEKKTLEQTSLVLQSESFYRFWTQKEAYCKALGVGLRGELSAIRAMPADQHGAALVIDEAATGQPGHFVHELAVMPGFAATLCVQAACMNLNMAELQPGLQSPGHQKILFPNKYRSAELIPGRNTQRVPGR
jgi:4'-phosphopantetheinyl transferase